MFASFPMRWNHFIVLALTAGVAAFAAAQSPSPSPQSAKPHHARVHHPRTHHAAPPANAEAKDHQRTMKEETASRKRESLNNTEGKQSVRAEKSASSAQRAESAREARAHRRDRVKPHSIKKRHATSSTSTVGENRFERERRQRAESRPGYEDGFRAGFAAGLAARRGEAEGASTAPDAHQPGSRTLSSQSSEAAPVPESVPETDTEVHVSDATVRSTSPLPGAAAAAGDVHVPTNERSHSRPEDASLEASPKSGAGMHIAPISLTASLHLLHEPAVAPLRGTLASLERQNQRLDAEGLQRVEDESDLEYRIARKLLVPLPISDRLAVNPGLPVERRYCRPWTSEFLTDLARMHEAVFHRPLRVDSAVRTVDYQRHLISFNANAAPAEGDVASPHETGATVDIAKRGMTWREIGWMRRYLKSLESAGLVDVEEEFHQSCFHITVYDTYGRRDLVPRPSTPNDGGSDGNSVAAAEASGGQGQ